MSTFNFDWCNQAGHHFFLNHLIAFANNQPINTATIVAPSNMPDIINLSLRVLGIEKLKINNIAVMNDTAIISAFRKYRILGSIL
jgi:hypothetical protein